MNRAKQRGEALDQVLVLRRISTRLAQQQAAQTQFLLREAERMRDAESSRLTDVIAQWDSARSASRFDPLTLSAWGQAVNLQAAAVIESEAGVERHDAEMAEAEAAHSRASAEEKCADSLLRRARIRLARDREEARLAERDDVNTRKIFVR